MFRRARICVRRAGKGGSAVFDIANIDKQGFSERMTAAPVFSDWPKKFHVLNRDAVAVADTDDARGRSARVQLPENEEQPIPLLYGFLYVADREEAWWSSATLI